MGPPLTWENNGSAPRYDERTPSPVLHSPMSSQTPVVTEKGNRDLPPLPPSSANSSRFQQSTVRHMPQPVDNNHKTNSDPLQREPSDEYEDYGDQYTETYSSTKSNNVQQKMQDMHLEDDLPDTTMLDSVVLPAIASVSNFFKH